MKRLSGLLEVIPSSAPGLEAAREQGTPFLILNMHLLDPEHAPDGQDRFLILNMHLTGRIAS
jgi:hypothetical protein